MYRTLVNALSHNNITKYAASNDEHLQCLIKLNGLCTRFNKLQGVPAKMRFYLVGGLTYHNYHKQVSTEDIDGFFLIVTENGGEFSMQIDTDDKGHNDGCGYNAELEQVWQMAFLNNKNKNLWLGDYETKSNVTWKGNTNTVRSQNSEQLQCLGEVPTSYFNLNIDIHNRKCNLDLHLYANIPSEVFIEEPKFREILMFEPKDYIEHAHNIPMLQHIFVLDFDFFRYEQFRVLLERLMGFVVFVNPASYERDRQENIKKHSKFPKTYRRVKQLFEPGLALLDITLQKYVNLYPHSNEFVKYNKLLKDPKDPYLQKYLTMSIRDTLKLIDPEVVMAEWFEEDNSDFEE
jgi:hypothetical protein